MKKFLLILAVLTAITGLNTDAKAENNLNILSSTGMATTNAEPDTAMFSIAVETENKLLSNALNENTAKAQKVIGEIKKLLGKDDSIKTTGFNASPVYSYDNKERKSVLTGYRVTNMVSVKTKKISEVGKIIDKAISSGANKADDLDFMLENKSKYTDELLRKASEQAKQKAQSTAEALGQKIKGINRVSTSFSDESISPYYRASFSTMEMKTASDGAAPPIEAGEIKLNATVNVDFIIEPAK